MSTPSPVIAAHLGDQENVKSINFSEILLSRNREKLNENFTEPSLIYIKHISESHGNVYKINIGKSDRISNISDEFIIKRIHPLLFVPLFY